MGDRDIKANISEAARVRSEIVRGLEAVTGRNYHH
jgi:hypothetical protein